MSTQGDLSTYSDNETKQGECNYLLWGAVLNVLTVRYYLHQQRLEEITVI